MKDRQFFTSFSELVLRPIVSEEKDKYLAIASLAQVSKFIPNIDTQKNQDVLPVAFDACVVNRVNKNTDMIDTQTALAMYKQFAYKPINVEHNRQKVIGMILIPGFSEFGSSKPLTEAEASQMTGPFNITLGGLIWRLVAPELADLIEDASDPTSPKYLSVSASWELGFTGYKIALMEGGKKNLSEATRIIDDPKEVEEVQNKLIALGGDGKFEDLFAYRMPSFDVLPLGIGFTEKPAAEVKGIATNQSIEIGEDKSPAIGKPPEKDIQEKVSIPNPILDNKIGIVEKPAFGEPTKDSCASEAQEKENKIKISQKEISNVKIERNMKITSLKDITDDSIKQCTASAVSEFISTELKKGNDEWLKEKNTLTTQLTETQANSAKLEETMKQMQATLQKLESEKAEAAKVEQFNVRMSKVNETYELDEEAMAAIADDVKSIASEEDFGKWFKKQSILLKGFAKVKPPVKKNDVSDKPGADKEDVKKAKADEDAEAGCKKKAKAEDCEDTDDSEAKKAKASEAAAAVIDKVIDGADKSKGGLPNGSALAAPTLKEKYATAFAKENFIISR